MANTFGHIWLNALWFFIAAACLLDGNTYAGMESLEGARDFEQVDLEEILDTDILSLTSSVRPRF